MMTYTPGTIREVVAANVSEAEGVSLIHARPPRSGEVLALETNDDETVTVVALTAGERCPTCGRAGR